LAKLPEGRFAGTSAVARTIDAPPNYLGKLLHILSRVGLVQSRR
jgi:DNA-binding IscR family transcriptional regulator